MGGVSIGVKLCVFQLFVEQLPLPNGMAIVLYVVYEESGKRKSSKSLYVSADWSVHDKEISDGRLLKDCIEDSRSSLRVSQHGKVVLVLQGIQYLLKHLQRKGLNGFLAALRSTIARTINSHYVKLLHIGNPNQILVQKICILIC